MCNIAAFFDIDGTLARKSLMEENLKRLILNEIVDEDVWNIEIKPIYDDYNKRYTDYNEYLTVVTKAYNEALVGIPYEFIDFLAQQVIRDRGDVVYTYTRSRIEYHKKQGHKIFFISGSPEFLVKWMAEKYEVTDYKGTEFQVEDGKFTGEYKKMWDSEDKAVIINEFKEKYDIDFNYSYAYGDTKGDISMFEAVGNPIAINPVKTLLKYIQDDEDLMSRIRIIVERKDVIYQVPADVKFMN